MRFSNPWHGLWVLLVVRSYAVTVNIHREEPKFINPDAACSTQLELDELSSVDDVLYEIGNRLDFPAIHLTRTKDDKVEHVEDFDVVLEVAKSGGILSVHEQDPLEPDGEL